MLLLYNGCLETKRALQIQTVPPPKGDYGELPLEKSYLGGWNLKPQFWPTHLFCHDIGKPSKLTANSVARAVTVVTVSHLSYFTFCRHFNTIRGSLDARTVFAPPSRICWTVRG